LIAQATQLHGLHDQIALGDLAGLAERDDTRNALGAGPQAVFMAGAGEDTLQFRPAPDILRSDPLGRVELMPRDRE
jgi:hypothetical protein